MDTNLPDNGPSPTARYQFGTIEPTPALDALRQTDFTDLEAVRDYYFRISEVLRAYIEGTFPLNATDLTTEEILPRLAEIAELESTLSRGRGGAAEVARFLRRSVEEGREAPTVSEPDRDSDAVHVMTIYGAKGLDFEHVYLAQIHKETGSFGTPEAVLHRVDGVAELGKDEQVKTLDIAEIVDPGRQTNRDQVFFGARVTYADADGEERTVRIVGVDEADAVAQAVADADSVIIVPGYGMAVAQAQHKLRELCDNLESRGVTVKYRASLEDDCAAMEAIRPDLAIGTTPVVQKGKELGIPSLYFTNAMCALRLGSYSRRSTTPWMPSLSRLKSIMR